MINLVFLLDITGSMGSELEGVKETVRHLVASVFEEEYAVMITIITFTESSQGCFVTNHSFTEGEEGDGLHHLREAKAAFAELLTLDSTMPTIAFLITDAGPHLLAETRTREAEHEINFLKEKHSIVDSDMFNVLALVQAHFEGNLIVNVVSTSRTATTGCTGASPKSSTECSSSPRGDFRRLPLSKRLPAIRAWNTFIFYDLEGFSVPSCEADVKNNAIPVAGDTRDVLFAFLDRATVVVGDRFAKRAIAASGLREQVELLITIAQCLTGKLGYNDALDCATSLVETIRDLLPDENQNHLKLTAESLPGVLQQKITTASELEASISAITLLTTQEATEDALEEDDLPEKNGKPDFMDAWSAVITKVSPDVVTARDFLTLIGSEEATGGLSIRARDYNYAQMVADPDDALGSALVRAASGTQVLDILTGLLSGAPAGLFCPNMFRGTVSASLMALLEQRDEPLSDFQWELVAKLVHSIRLVMTSVKPLPKMPVNPEDAVGKLLFFLLRRSQEKYDGEALLAVLKELLATRVHKFIRFNEARYLALVERMVGYTHESVVEDAFDPHALDQDVWRFGAKKAGRFAATTSFFQAFERCANNLIRCVAVSPKKFKDDTQVVPTLQEVWPTCTEELPKFLLLQKRSARYRIVRDAAAADGKINWELNHTLDEDLDSATYEKLAMQLLRRKYDAFLRELRERRANEAAEQRWSRALKTARASSMEAFLEKLALIRDSASQEHKLLWKALKQLGAGEKNEVELYEEKLEVLITGRLEVRRGEFDVVFNRGNLHPHPDKLAPMSAELQAKLRELRRKYDWPIRHKYRDGKSNRNGHSNDTPSEWAKKRSDAEKTFWEDN
ncbi:hypothetical protein PRIC1_013761 [Phytophthora ramorum]